MKRKLWPASSQRVTRQPPERFAVNIMASRLAESTGKEPSMTTLCTSKVAPNAEKTALLVASGGEIDRLIADVLASEGWSVQRVDNTQLALSVARAKQFDLIITGREGDWRKTLSFVAELGVLALT